MNPQQESTSFLWPIDVVKIKANVLFGNYRLPIKIYYICSFTVDEKKRPAVGTVFAVFCVKNC